MLQVSLFCNAHTLEATKLRFDKVFRSHAGEEDEGSGRLTSRWISISTTVCAYVLLIAPLSEECSIPIIGQSLVHKREIASCVATLSFTYYYDHQAT